jgi:hypothetical protein
MGVRHMGDGTPHPIWVMQAAGPARRIVVRLLEDLRRRGLNHDDHGELVARLSHGRHIG